MTSGPGVHRTRTRLDVIALLWFAASAVWGVVVVVTDQLAWPLALWVAATLGPLTSLTTQQQRRRGDSGGNVEQDER